MTKLTRPVIALTAAMFPQLASGQDISHANEIVSFLMTPEATQCVHGALREAVGNPDAEIKWGETAGSDGRYTLDLTTFDNKSDFTSYSARFGVVADNEGVRLVATSVSAIDLFNDKIYASYSVGGLTASFDNPRSQLYADYTQAAEVKLADDAWRCLYKEPRERYTTRRLEPIAPPPPAP